MIDVDIVELIIEEFGYCVQCVFDVDVEQVIDVVEDKVEDFELCLFVIMIMGYVDYGKILFLDVVCNVNVVFGEVGGIIQYIGVYQVIVEFGVVLLFFDILGYVVFMLMCVCGVQVIDIVVLVVVVDDVVMLQIIEVINYVKVVQVLMIVVINKIDKLEVNVDKVCIDFLMYEVVVEGMGGEVQDVEVLVKIGKGLDNFFEVIVFQVEIFEFKVNLNCVV